MDTRIPLIMSILPWGMVTFVQTACRLTASSPFDMSYTKIVSFIAIVKEKRHSFECLFPVLGITQFQDLHNQSRQAKNDCDDLEWGNPFFF